MTIEHNYPEKQFSLELNEEQVFILNHFLANCGDEYVSFYENTRAGLIGIKQNLELLCENIYQSREE